MPAVLGLVALAALLWWASQQEAPSIDPALREQLGLPPEVVPPTPRVPSRFEQLTREREDAWRAGTYDDPHEVHTGDTLALIERLIELGRARWQAKPGVGAGGGVHATPASTPDDRRLLAEVECRRAIDHYGMPLSHLAPCVAAVSKPTKDAAGNHVPLDQRWYRYEEPAARRVLTIRI